MIFENFFFSIGLRSFYVSRNVIITFTYVRYWRPPRSRIFLPIFLHVMSSGQILILSIINLGRCIPRISHFGAGHESVYLCLILNLCYKTHVICSNVTKDCLQLHLHAHTNIRYMIHSAKLNHNV